MKSAIASTWEERLAYGKLETVQNSDRASLRIAMLKHQYSMPDIKLFLSSRFEGKDIDNPQVRELFGETRESLDRRIPICAWEDEYNQIVSDWFARSKEQRQRVSISLDPMMLPVLPFSNHVTSEVEHGLAQIIDDRVLLTSLSQPNMGRFVDKIARAAILELNVNRINGMLSSDTSEKRWNEFFGNFSRLDYFEKFYDEYPVAARSLIIEMNAQIASRVELGRRLISDWEEISNYLDLNGQRPLEVEFGKGDSHAGGKTVCFIKCDGGGRFVYKPRPTDIENKAVALCAWLGEREGLEIFLPKTLDRGTHGWQEFVAHEPCKSLVEVRRYYKRFGQLISLAYAFGTTDLHFENLIATKDYPVAIDLETFLQPSLGERESGSLIERFAENAYRESVLITGLLPLQSMAPSGEAEVADLSGLGFETGTLSPFLVPALVGGGRDDASISFERPRIDGQNNPTVNGKAIHFRNYINEICAGFREGYKAILRCRDELVASTGFISQFSNSRVRVVLRPTTLYAQLLFARTHPDYLRDGLDDERLMSVLSLNKTVVGDNDGVVGEELESLRNGDIPLFSIGCSERFIETHSGIPVKKVQNTPLENLKDRLYRMSEEDLERQVWYVRCACIGVDAGDTFSPGKIRSEFSYHGLSNSKSICSSLDACKTSISIISAELEKTSFGKALNGWMNLDFVSEHAWRLGPVRGDLYAGLSGIGFYFLEAAKLANDVWHRQAVRHIGEILIDQINHIPEDGDPNNLAALSDVGLFGSCGGTIYFLSHLGDYGEGLEWDIAVHRLLEKVASRSPNEPLYDVISGSAGLILSLDSYLAVVDDDLALDLVKRHADRLADSAEPCEGGLAWTTPDETHPLGGMSHGAGGIAAALAIASSIICTDKYDSVIEAALDFELTTRDPVTGRWRDLRSNVGGDLSAWCHGAPGIAGARIMIRRAREDLLPDRLSEELYLAGNDAFRITERLLLRGTNWNQSLCHGYLGNLWILRDLSRVDVIRDDKVDSLMRMAEHDIFEHGVTCGVPLGLEVPGLMTGLAGVGLGLLGMSGINDGVCNPLLADRMM